MFLFEILVFLMFLKVTRNRRNVLYQGSKPRQAEPLSVQDEEQLWTKKLLGRPNGRSLVDTMLFMCGTYFALRSGQEHRALRLNPSQIELV